MEFIEVELSEVDQDLFVDTVLYGNLRELPNCQPKSNFWTSLQVQSTDTAVGQIIENKEAFFDFELFEKLDTIIGVDKVTLSIIPISYINKNKHYQQSTFLPAFK